VIARAKAGARSVVTSAGAPWMSMALAKNRVAAFVIALLRHEHVDDLALLVDGSIDVTPDT
jgi:hypothetical protein